MKGKREGELEKVPDYGGLQIRVKKQRSSSVTISINNSRDFCFGQAIEHMTYCALFLITFKEGGASRLHDSQTDED